MENKSYPEILHNISMEFCHGEKNRVEQFEKAILLLIDQIVTNERNKLLSDINISKSEHYMKNNNIKSDCDSCSRNDIIIGCTLKHENKCIINGKYTKYRRGHLLPCDRCKTYSVITKIDRVSDNSKDSIPRPSIRFMCLNCKNYPIIDTSIFKGYELRGMEFTEKYLHIYRRREKQGQKEESVQHTDSAQHTDSVQHTDSAQTTDRNESKIAIQQEEPEIEVVVVPTEQKQ